MERTRQIELLQIIFGALVIATLLGQIFLYKNKSSNSFYLYNMVLAVIIAASSYSSLPQNYRTEQVIALALGGIGLLSMVPRYLKENSAATSNIMLSISVIGGLLYLLFGI